MKKLQILGPPYASALTALVLAGFADAQANVLPPTRLLPPSPGRRGRGDADRRGGHVDGHRSDHVRIPVAALRRERPQLLNLAGATGRTYAVQTSDVNNRLRVSVTARKRDRLDDGELAADSRGDAAGGRDAPRRRPLLDPGVERPASEPARHLGRRVRAERHPLARSVHGPLPRDRHARLRRP